MAGLLTVTHSGIETAYMDFPALNHRPDTPLILVHGFTGSSLDFVSQAPALAEHTRVLAYDQRGHGHSSNTGPYELTQLATDLVAFMDALALPTCHVLGHSLGGMVVLRALLAAPQRFKSAILMDTAPAGVELFPSAMQAQLNELVRAGGCAALFTGMQQQPQRPVVQRGIDYLGNQEHWRRIREKLEHMDPEAFVALSVALREQDDVTPRLDEIDVPVSVLVGAEDTPFLNPAKTLHTHILDSRLQIIADAGHSPQYENADAWHAAVAQHLAWSR